MKVRVDSLKHHPLNELVYKLSGLDELMDSIKEVGLLQPLTIDQYNQVISGNRRFECLRILGIDKVEVNKMNVKEGDETLLLIHFNQQRVKSVSELLAEYDTLKLYYKKNRHRLDIKGKTIREVVSNDINVKDGQLARLLFIRKMNPEHIDLIEKGILSVNQSYLISQRKNQDDKSRNHVSTTSSKIKNGDKFRFFKKSSDDMSELKDGEVSLILSSPPFWNLRMYDKEKGLGNEKTPDEYVENLTNHLFNECWRTLSDDGNFFLEIGDSFLNSNLQNIPHKVAIRLQEKGFIQRNSIVVQRSNPKPSSSKTNLTPTYSMLFHFVKSKNYKYELTLTKLSGKTKPSHPPRHRSVKDGKITNNLSVYIPNPNGKNVGDFLSEDIIRTAVSNQKSFNGIVQHPAQFPEQLVWFVLNSTCVLPYRNDTNSSPLVCDPFCGGLTVNRVIEMINKQNSTNIRFVGYDVKKWF